MVPEATVARRPLAARPPTPLRSRAPWRPIRHRLRRDRSRAGRQRFHAVHAWLRWRLLSRPGRTCTRTSWCPISTQDPEVAGWLAQSWEHEEVQHGAALRAYVEHAWPDFDWRSVYDTFSEYAKTCTLPDLEPSHAARACGTLRRWKWVPRRSTAHCTITSRSRCSKTSRRAYTPTRCAITSISTATFAVISSEKATEDGAWAERSPNACSPRATTTDIAPTATFGAPHAWARKHGRTRLSGIPGSRRHAGASTCTAGTARGYVAQTTVTYLRRR